MSAGTIWDHSFFFTAVEREAIEHAQTSVDTHPASFVTRMFLPIWVFISKNFVSETVAPNAITFIGLLSAIQSYQVISQYYDVSPGLIAAGGGGPSTAAAAAAHHHHSSSSSSSSSGGGGGGAGAAVLARPHSVSLRAPNSETVQLIATIISCALLVVSIACGSVDGVHAKRCRSATPLGDIFSRTASSFSRIFFALTLLKVMNVTDIYVRWHVLLYLQLIEFSTVLGRINAENIQKRRKKIKNLAFFLTYCLRDSELSFLLLVILLLRLFVPASHFALFFDPAFVQGVYAAFVLLSFALVCLLKMRTKHKYAIGLCLAVRVVPLFQLLLPLNQYSDFTIISDAVVVALLSIEVYISSLARRRINAAVIFICLGSRFNTVFGLIMTMLYLVGMLTDISYTTRIPLFVPIKNVYIDGVFDLCHAGHKKVMENALLHGNRLIVGVCGDEACTGYKRRPIMTTEERVREVEMCKYVSKVIPDAPIEGPSEEFIKKYNIHVVVCGQEYDHPGDTYYSAPRRMGILRAAPRTQGISTSVLISRIRAASSEDIVAKDKTDGRSLVQEGQ